METSYAILKAPPKKKGKTKAPASMSAVDIGGLTDWATVLDVLVTAAAAALSSDLMMAIVKKENRAQAAAITNTSRTVAQSMSPPISTQLMTVGAYTFPFVLGGGIKIAYDIAIYLNFRKIKPPEEARKRSGKEEE